jgi:thiol-disulfide isomerase/thioredoxin
MRRVFNNTNLLIVAIAVLGAMLGFLAGGWMQSPDEGPATRSTMPVGTRRPDLALPDLDQGLRQLSEWDGKLVLLNFWASWCGPCRDEMPLLDAVAKEHAAAGLQVIGVAVDETTAVRAFLAKRPVAYPILIDAPSGAADSSRLFGDDRAVLPYSVLIAPDGRLLTRRFGSFTRATLEDWLAPYLPPR